MPASRQLAAIMFTDIVGYTALMGDDEQKAVALSKHYNTTLNKAVELHEGKELNNYGDGSLCTFPSATEAVNCAVELQKELQSEPEVIHTFKKC
jgi:class 3 adenylate cyclase